MPWDFNFRNTTFGYVCKGFSKSMELNPALNFNFQLARIYGEQGNVEAMYNSYLNLVIDGKNFKKLHILRSTRRILYRRTENQNNILLKRSVIGTRFKRISIFMERVIELVI